MKAQANFMAIDCETANHQQSICQIGMVVVREGKIVEKLEYLVQPPYNKYDPMSSRIHGITSEHTKNSPPFPEVWNAIKGYFRNETLVAHNGKSADFNYLRKELNKHQLDHPLFYALIDTMDFFGTYKLEELCQFYNIEFENRHNSLKDAEACAKLFLKRFDQDVILPTKKSMNLCLAKAKDQQQKNLNALIENADPNNIFFEKGVLFTGFIGADRDFVKKELLKRGAIIKSGVTRNVDIFIKGDEPGPSKMKKLKDFQDKGFDILVLEKDEFYDKINS